MSILIFFFSRYRTKPYWAKIRRLTIPNVIIAGLSMIAYVWFTMMPIDTALKHQSSPHILWRGQRWRRGSAQLPSYDNRLQRV
jgi:hypothetical protein